MPWSWNINNEPLQTGGAVGTASEAAQTGSWQDYNAEYLASRLEDKTGRFKDTRNLTQEERLIYLDKVSGNWEQEAEACLKEEFNQWLQGTHKLNDANAVYQNGPTVPRRLHTYGHAVTTPRDNWNHTPWGKAQLTHLPGVREYLRNQLEHSSKAELQMNLLAEHGPQDLQEAWMYFKHWVKQRPVGEDCVNAESTTSLSNRRNGFPLIETTRPDGPQQPWEGQRKMPTVTPPPATGYTTPQTTRVATPQATATAPLPPSVTSLPRPVPHLRYPANGPPYLSIHSPPPPSTAMGVNPTGSPGAGPSVSLPGDMDWSDMGPQGEYGRPGWVYTPQQAQTEVGKRKDLAFRGPDVAGPSSTPPRVGSGPTDPEYYNQNMTQYFAIPQVPNWAPAPKVNALGVVELDFSVAPVATPAMIRSNQISVRKVVVGHTASQGVVEPVRRGRPHADIGESSQQNSRTNRGSSQGISVQDMDNL